VNGIYLAIVIVGNYLGPVAAGYVAVSQAWRWVFWYCTIFMGVVSLAMIFFLEETKYTPLAMDGREVVLSTTVGPGDSLVKVDSTTKAPTTTRLGTISVDATEAAQNTERRRLVEIDHSIPLKSYRERHTFWSLEKQVTSENRTPWMHFFQPFHILVTFPAVMFTALQWGFLIAMLAILAVTQATLYPFPPYNFTPIGVGNMNLPPGKFLSAMRDLHQTWKFGGNALPPVKSANM
jgi:MFS family permease